MIIVWLGRLGFVLLLLAFALSCSLFLASFGDQAWIYADDSVLLTILNPLFYGSLLLAPLATFLIGRLIAHWTRLRPSQPPSLRLLLRRFRLTAIWVLGGFVLIAVGLYINTTWVMPPLDGSKDELARFVQSGNIRNLRVMSLAIMGLTLAYGSIMFTVLLPIHDPTT